MLRKILFAGFAVLAAMLSCPGTGLAAGDTVTPPKQIWSFDGPFGTYDRAAMQRGFQVYKQVCSSCHSLNYVSYRNLADLGYSEAQIKTVAGEYMMTDGPNDEGEMFDRPGRPSDRFKSPFANEQQARSVNSGAYPADLSLIIKARHYGPDYLYALLTGYEAPPEGTELMPGMYWNRYFPGHQIAMPPPMTDGQVVYSNGDEASVEQASRDLVHFLAWASEPHMETRKSTGWKVLLFLLAFAGIMYAAKKRLWANVS